jgi:hypothetical protein
MRGCVCLCGVAVKRARGSCRFSGLSSCRFSRERITCRTSHRGSWCARPSLGTWLWLSVQSQDVAGHRRVCVTVRLGYCVTRIGAGVNRRAVDKGGHRIRREGLIVARVAPAAVRIRQAAIRVVSVGDALAVTKHGVDGVCGGKMQPSSCSGGWGCLLAAAAAVC